MLTTHSGFSVENGLRTISVVFVRSDVGLAPEGGRGIGEHGADSRFVDEGEPTGPADEWEVKGTQEQESQKPSVNSSPEPRRGP